MPLVKDVPILDLLRGRMIVTYGSIDAARTAETLTLWKHRKMCYQQAMDYVRLAEGIPCAEQGEPTMDFSEENEPCLKD
jgi:hypothetical protein